MGYGRQVRAGTATAVAATPQGDTEPTERLGRTVAPPDVAVAASDDARAVSVERLILHRLDNAAGRLELVDDEVVLDARGAAFFAAHITAATQRADWCASFLEPAGEVPAACRRLLAGSREFVAASHELALRLYNQMRTRPHQITPGDFVVTLFRLPDQDEPHLALLKLDMDDERLVREFERSGSRMRVRIRPAENLLPETKRLQKCALLRPSAHPSGFDVTLLDTQAGPRSDGVAAYFYRGFLTAVLAPSARRHTRLFLSATETWLGEYAPRFQPLDCLGFYRARRAALAGDFVSLPDFAAAALPETLTGVHPLRQSLVAHLRSALFDRESSTAESFVVDRATADPLVRTVTLELDGGARLRVDARLFDELVRVAGRRTGDQKVQFVIESLTLKEVTGG
jgi:hypothetical protein